MHKKPHDFMEYHLRTINLYHIAPQHVCLKLIPQTGHVKVTTLIKRSSSLFVVLGREILCSSWMQSNVSTMVKTYSCGYRRDFGSPSATRLLFVFNFKHSDGGIGDDCSPCGVHALCH